jgi:hypothetical protein
MQLAAAFLKRGQSTFRSFDRICRKLRSIESCSRAAHFHLVGCFSWIGSRIEVLLRGAMCRPLAS